MLDGLIATITLLAPAEEGGIRDYLPSMLTWAKMVNLLIFIGLAIFLLRRPVGETLRTRREEIRRELLHAQAERDAALAKLEEVNARLTRLDQEVEAIGAQAQREAIEEGERIARSTDEEARKLREQAQREIQGAGKLARQDLRRYAAEQSVRLAEEIIRRDLRPEDDERLVGDYVEELRGIKG